MGLRQGRGQGIGAALIRAAVELNAAKKKPAAVEPLVKGKPVVEA